MLHCRCPTSQQSALAISGFVCGGNKGGHGAHWLCRKCLGPRGTCVQHPKATVMPVKNLWSSTTFDPMRACSYSDRTEFNKLALQDVTVFSAGPHGHQIKLRDKLQLHNPLCVKVELEEICVPQYAVLWPNEQTAFTFPMLAFDPKAPAAAPRSVKIRTIDSWPAWTSDKQFGYALALLGMKSQNVQKIMASPCARNRWWFVMPQATPPLLPPRIGTQTLLCSTGPNLGQKCTVPIMPYAPSFYLTKMGTVRCAWCNTMSPTKQAWAAQCAPDVNLKPVQQECHPKAPLHLHPQPQLRSAKLP